MTTNQIRESFINMNSRADVVTVNDSPILPNTSSGNGDSNSDDLFYIYWTDSDSGVGFDCHINESAFLPENNPAMTCGGEFILKNSEGDEVNIYFYKLEKMTE